MSNRLDATNCTHEVALARVAELESKLEGYATREANGMQQVAELEDELTAARNAALSEGVRSGELQSRLDEATKKVAQYTGYFSLPEVEQIKEYERTIERLESRLDGFVKWARTYHTLEAAQVQYVIELRDLVRAVERLESK